MMIVPPSILPNRRNESESGNTQSPRIFKRHPAEPDKEVRLACRDIFRSSKLTGKLIPLIEEVLAAGEIEPPQPAPDMLPPAIPEPELLGDSGHRGRSG